MFTLTEKDVTKQVLDYLQAMHIHFFRNNVGVAKYHNKDGSYSAVSYGEVGIADYTIIFYHNGMPIIGFLELKATKGKQREEQKLFQEWCKQEHILYVLARSYEDVQEGIREYKRQFA